MWPCSMPGTPAARRSWPGRETNKHTEKRGPIWSKGNQEEGDEENKEMIERKKSYSAKEKENEV